MKQSARINHARDLWKGVYLDDSNLNYGFIKPHDKKSVPGRLLKGNTEFFREMDVYKSALSNAAAIYNDNGESITILCGGGSIGAEAHTLAYMAQERGYDWLRILTIDISERFTKIAGAGIYPQQMTVGIEPVVREEIFDDYAPNFIRVKDKFRNMVEARQTSLLRLVEKNIRSDVTVSMNALMYFEPRAALRVSNVLGAITRHAIVMDWELSAKPELPAFQEGNNRYIFPAINGWNVWTRRNPDTYAYK